MQNPPDLKTTLPGKKIIIDPGQRLVLQDGNTVSVGGAQYAQIITGVAISGSVVTNITGNGLNLYYAADIPENAYLDGNRYKLTDGGELIPVTPYCTGDDLDLDGICDTADNCPCTYNPAQADDDHDGHGNICPLADFDDDLDVDGADLSAFAGFLSTDDLRADVFEDGIIDGLDIKKFAREFGWKY